MVKISKYEYKKQNNFSFDEKFEYSFNNKKKYLNNTYI